MSKLEKIIFILAIVVVLIIIVIMGIIYFNRGEVVYNIDEVGNDDTTEEIDSTIQYVTTRNDYYAVETCVNKFYIYYMSLFDSEEADIDDEEENKEYLYNMLDEDYINFKNITLNNIETKLEEIKQSDVNVNKMYVSQKSQNIYLYLVQGRIREKSSEEIKDFEVLIKIDASNKTFSVYLEDYIQQNLSDIKLGQEINMQVSDSVENKKINIYDYEIINDEAYVQDLFAKFKKEILYDRQLVYNNLNEEYREKRFGDFSTFETYAKNNVRNNIIMKLSKYQKTKYEDYTEYVCIDQNGNYYIFNENSVMNYNVILDTYTVDLPEYIKKYDSATDQVKVGMNIERAITAIEAKDYKYVYNKLDETFKNNYFNIIEKFSTFINNNFYEENTIEYLEFKNLGGIYTYSLNIMDSDDLEKVNKITFIMKLEENRDFTMSFGIE